MFEGMSGLQPMFIYSLLPNYSYQYALIPEQESADLFVSTNVR